jgi:hypothetical protein
LVWFKAAVVSANDCWPYIFRSVDGKWQFITGIQKTGDFNNPYVNRSLMSFQKAIMIIAGKVRSTTYLRDILVDVKAKYSNKETMRGKTLLRRVIETYPEERFSKLDGFDDAIIGVDSCTMKLIYSEKKILSNREWGMMHLSIR